MKTQEKKGDHEKKSMIHAETKLAEEVENYLN
jgi:hypothetical protein